MIQITSNAKELAERLDMAISKLANVTIKTHRRAAEKGMQFARRISPVKSGFLKSHITYRTFTNHSVIRSYAINRKTGFPYNLWVNENIRTVRLRGRQRTYASTRHTGIPAYFDVTFNYLTTFFPELMIINVTNVLRGTIGKR